MSVHGEELPFPPDAGNDQNALMNGHSRCAAHQLVLSLPKTQVGEWLTGYAAIGRPCKPVLRPSTSWNRSVRTVFRKASQLAFVARKGALCAPRKPSRFTLR